MGHFQLGLKDIGFDQMSSINQATLEFQIYFAKDLSIDQLSDRNGKALMRLDSCYCTAKICELSDFSTRV